MLRSLVVASVVAFLVLALFAMVAYPGGTSWDQAARGHQFWSNYLCDLARPTALNGHPNPVGSTLAQAAMSALALGLVPWWTLVARLVPSHRRAGLAMRVFGSFAVVGVFAVIALPGDRFGALHGIACVVAAVPGLAAAVLAVVVLLRDRNAPRAVAWIGALTAVVALVDFALYLPDVFALAPAVMAVAVLERISVGLLLVWMLVCSAAWRRS